MKTRYCEEKEDPITIFCKATSQCRETALFYLEFSHWNLHEAVTSFLHGHIPPLPTTTIQPSPSPSSSTTSTLTSKNCDFEADEPSTIWLSSFLKTVSTSIDHDSVSSS
ncbi:unnamed protein product [Cochlearia groenlandica]